MNTALERYHNVSARTSRLITQQYSTSFSLGTLLLEPEQRKAIYAIYGFVRVADEIVDSFLEFDKQNLLDEFRQQTYQAIERGISVNPVLHSFQRVVKSYSIDKAYIDAFLNSMAMDLDDREYDRSSFEQYIYGSAEVVGLMCLQVFCKHKPELFEPLVEPARRLGAAFQKVNFLRDLKADKVNLGRTYFPNVDFSAFCAESKCTIENEIEQDFHAALKGIRQLPTGSKLGVYVAYVYYLKLFEKIRQQRPEDLMQARIRISNPRKLALMLVSYFRFKLRYV
jgi:15-cis-phytoene synthase